jgi:NADPH-dependent curcumin reductase CurA
MTENRAFRLRRRPQGRVTSDDLELVREPLPELRDGQALVRTDVLSVDPTNRIWMSELRGYLPPVPLGDVMRGLGVGTVVASQREDLPVGARVLGWTGWQEHVVADDAQLISPFSVLPDPLPAPPSAFLGVLGHTGITAWLGLEIGDPKPGETLVVSAAAGAVGSVAVQLGKARGARVVAIAGGPEKCAHVVDELGADAAVDHRAADWEAQLEAATPDGVDVDFENVGGAILDAVLLRSNIGARVALCGMIGEYNSYDGGATPVGQHAIGQLIMQRITMRGFLVLDHADRFEAIVGELAGELAAGRLKAGETTVEGLEHAVDALNRLFDGENRGKLVVQVS